MSDVIYKVYSARGSKCIRKFNDIDEAKEWCWLKEREYRIELVYEGESKPRVIYV